MDMARIFQTVRRHRTARAGLVIVIAVSTCALAAQWLAPQDPNAQDLTMLSSPPSLAHPLGTDIYGRDLLSRLLYGARVSLAIGLTAAAIAVVLGTAVGVVAGLLGGRVDWALMRLVDVLLGFPRLFVVLLVVGFGSPSIWLTLIVLGMLSWMGVARVIRGEVVVIREMLYLKASIAIGLSRWRVITGYVLPNVAGPVIVSSALLIGSMILVEAALGFLGLGVQAPESSWGTILNQGRVDPVGAWWISTFAGFAVVITVVGFNLLGDGLRDAFDPRSAVRPL